jgi:hypothetical protein
MVSANSPTFFFLFVWGSWYISTLHFVGLLTLDCFVLSFSLSLTLCRCFFLMTGAIGFVSSLSFVNKIYGAIKVD